MLIKGSVSSEKTEILAKNYAKLINAGIDSSKILAIVQNTNRKNQFLEIVFENLNVDIIEKLQVYSFYGLVYNTISDNWVEIENKIQDADNTKILPSLTGMEVSQMVMRKVIEEIKFEGYNSKKSLLHQLFRRYSLIVQNNLSDEEVKWRSEQVLKESFAPDAKAALEEFKRRTLEYRALDYLRQSLIFNYIYQNTDYFSGIEYLFVDDGDELTPICLDFIKFLKPQLKDAFIAYDVLGASRSGYLSADKSFGMGFEKVFQDFVFADEKLELSDKNKLSEDAQTLFENVLEQKNTRLKNFSLSSISKRAQMLDLGGIERIKYLLKNGVKPSEISVVTPQIDDMLKFCLKEGLSTRVNLLFLSGSEKLVQNPIVRGVLSVLKACNKELHSDFDEFDVRFILDFLQIPLKYCKDILYGFEQSKAFIKYEFVLPEYNLKYAKFLEVIEKLASIDKLSLQVYKIYDELVEVGKFSKDEILKFNFFIEKIEDFENVFLERIDKQEIVIQLENSIVSENPHTSLEINENDLVVATPQKIIDNLVQTKYQIWLDVSSDEWVKNDTGPLYNAWVMQAGWEKQQFSVDDNLELSHQKTARILRKLALCASEHIYAFASLFDGSGLENYGGIEKYLAHENEIKEIVIHKPISPREDQKPVLDYKSGTMAISAVPGAGKTTILLSLILKLLSNGINPENIFVLTYMDSAARNFRERIQNTNQDLIQLPNISTIHGLALKILKENANYERLGLNVDFEICDDTQRSRILREIATKLEIKKTELEDFDRAVSIIKIGGAEKPTNLTSLLRGEGALPLADKKMQKFFDFYHEYKNILQADNLIDYDDMLLFSVRLLEQNKDILEYYQEICHYVIEDEAQDSSSIQQRLIELLSAKHKNLIRCGDVNQAITATFSNSDVQGFRQFIEKSSTKVSMDCSQRCTRDVWMLANNLIKFANGYKESKEAFYNIFMKPVEGKNPEEKNAINSFVFENEFAEKNYVLKQIKLLLEKNPKATFGILLRSNFAVGLWTKFISNSGLKTITRSECLEQKAIFRAIFAVMKIIEKPFDNENIADNYDVLAELGLCKSNLYQTIKNASVPFVQMNVDKMNNLGLEMFYWDLIYWLSFSSLPPEELAIKIGLHYYGSEIEKSNVYLISTLIKRLAVSAKNYSELIVRLGELSKKPKLSGFKFFSEEEKNDIEILNGKVQIMTIHKSKGDEFDYVFLPEMLEKNLPIKFENVSLKKNSRFMESVRELNSDYKPKTDDDLKEFNLAEHLRLVYVAVTRAKRRLYITANKATKTSKVPEESAIFGIIGGKYHEV